MLTPVTSFTGMTSPDSPFNTTNWQTFTFTGANAVTLNANTTYAFQLTTSNGYFGFAPTTSSGFPGDAVSFNGTAGNATSATPHAFDFIFDVGLTATSVPEPTTYALLLVGAAFVLAARRRKRGSLICRRQSPDFPQALVEARRAASAAYL